MPFSFTKFENLKRKEGEFTFEHYFTFKIINSDNWVKKNAVDFYDSLDMNENTYTYACYYVNINFNLRLAEDLELDKIILILPIFGIQIWYK